MTPTTGRLNIRVKSGHKGSKKLGVQKGCRRIVKKCLFSQELATYLLASEKVNLLGRHPASARLWLVTNFYTYPEPSPSPLSGKPKSSLSQFNAPQSLLAMQTR